MTYATSVYGVDGVQFTNKYNNGNGFTDQIIINQTAFIADATMMYGMNLKSATARNKWKFDSSKPQYDYMNYRAIVTFDGNGATENTFVRQKFFYGKSGQRFTGTINRTGYDMLGWALYPTAKKAKYKTNSNVSNSWITNIHFICYDKITLYAVWSPHTVSVNFVTGKDTATTTGVKYTYDRKNERLPSIKNSEDSMFLGWSTDKNAIEADYTSGMAVTNEWIEYIYSTYGTSVTLYGVWEIADIPEEQEADLQQDVPETEPGTEPETGHEVSYQEPYPINDGQEYALPEPGQTETSMPEPEYEQETVPIQEPAPVQEFIPEQEYAPIAEEPVPAETAPAQGIVSETEFPIYPEPEQASMPEETAVNAE